MFRYESKRKPLASPKKFVLRLLKNFLVGLLLVGVALLLGVLGYHYICGLGWIDALYNASMILTGMGPVSPLATDGAKIFASGYAVFSGVIFLSTVALVLAPVLHRVIHVFHISDNDEQ